MTAIASVSAGGIYRLSSTWAGGVVPGDGDTITVTGPGDVDLDDARTVGHSPGNDDATKAILCAGGSLRLTAGAELTCRGDVGLDVGGFEMQDGAICELDSSQSASPATTRYKIGSINFNAGTGIVIIQGAPGNRCIVRSNSGGANGRLYNPEMAQITVDECNFQSIGDSTHPAFEGAANNGQTQRFSNCTFDEHCGPIGNAFAVGAQPTATIELIDFIHEGPSSLVLVSDGVAPGGRRLLQRCRLRGNVRFLKIDQFEFDDVVFAGEVFDFNGGPWLSANKVVFAMPPAANDWPAAGPVSPQAIVLRPGNPTNHHGLTTYDFTGELRGIIFDMPDGNDGAGDWITCNAPSVPLVVPIEDCIVTPAANGTSTGSLYSCLGGPDLKVRARHNTYYAGLAQYVGETFPGVPEMLDECDSNLAWNRAPNTARVISADPGVVEDVVLASKATHNGKFNAIGTGYDATLSFSSGTPGANDIDGDPLFLDDARNAKTWDLARGGPGTVENAIDALMDFSRSFDDLYQYLHTGFIVQNPAMRVGALDGTVMGAVQDPPPSAGGRQQPAIGLYIGIRL